jgi:hypothetical protein
MRPQRPHGRCARSHQISVPRLFRPWRFVRRLLPGNALGGVPFLLRPALYACAAPCRPSCAVAFPIPPPLPRPLPRNAMRCWCLDADGVGGHNPGAWTPHTSANGARHCRNPAGAEHTRRLETFPAGHGLRAADTRNRRTPPLRQAENRRLRSPVAHADSVSWTCCVRCVTTC